jgi:hypothetical protein
VAKSIEVMVKSPARLFHELDPSPLAGRDLDEQVESYILACARELHLTEYLLILHVPASEMPDQAQAAGLADAIRAYFSYRRDEEQKKLRSLLHSGRNALGVGFTFLFVCGALGWLLLRALPSPFGSFFNEGLLIIGWVALWRPLEILLYDWRPIRRDWQDIDALTRMRVEFLIAQDSTSGPPMKANLGQSQLSKPSSHNEITTNHSDRASAKPWMTSPTKPECDP